MDEDKFMDWQNNNWDELTNKFCDKVGREEFDKWCIEEFNNAQQLIEDLAEPISKEERFG